MSSINFKQKVLLVIGSVLFILAGIYPSWIETVEVLAQAINRVDHIGRYFIFAPPYESHPLKNQFINTTQLFIEWTVITLPTLILFFVLRDSNK